MPNDIFRERRGSMPLAYPTPEAHRNFVMTIFKQFTILFFPELQNLGIH